jgi:hypothetical protein
VTGFQAAKLEMVRLTSLPRDALHIYVGMAVFLAVALIFRRSLRDPRPIAAVLLVAIAGEIWDLIDRSRTGFPPAWSNSWHDLWNTMLWPAVIFLLARYTALLRR